VVQILGSITKFGILNKDRKITNIKMLVFMFKIIVRLWIELSYWVLHLLLTVAAMCSAEKELKNSFQSRTQPNFMILFLSFCTKAKW